MQTILGPRPRGKGSKAIFGGSRGSRPFLGAARWVSKATFVLDAKSVSLSQQSRDAVFRRVGRHCILSEIAIVLPSVLSAIRLPTRASWLRQGSAGGRGGRRGTAASRRPTGWPWPGAWSGPPTATPSDAGRTAAAPAHVPAAGSLPIALLTTFDVLLVVCPLVASLINCGGCLR